MPLIEYRQTVKRIVKAQHDSDDDGPIKKPFLHLAVHGMRDRGFDVALGTRDGRLCQPDVCEWLVTQLKKEFTVGVDGMFPGTDTLEHFRHGNKAIGFPGFGEKYSVFQLEFSHSLRFERFDRIIVVLSQIMQDFEKRFT